MQILVVMDPLEKLDLPKDTSVGFILAAFRRGWDVSICTVFDLFSLHDRVWTGASPVFPSTHSILDVGERVDVSLGSFDAGLMRVDPPVDSQYLHATHLLDLAANETLISNHPSGIRFANEKAYALQFPSLTPYTRLSSNGNQIREWLNQETDGLIVKPVDGHGGNGVFLLTPGDRNNASILEMLTQNNQRMVVVQTYLKAARIGDKRVIMIDGEAKGAILRVPKGDDHRGNIHVGGTVVPTELTERDLEICEAVGRRLRQDGLSFVGLDIIGDSLTEVNVTSPTGIREYYELTGIDLAETYLDYLAENQGV